ncbi:MAG: hypothetical protein WAT39_17305 [Planctomycetota bacterium]
MPLPRLLPCLASIAALAATARAQEAAATEVFPLYHLAGAVTPPAVPPWGSLLRFPTADTRVDLLDAEQNSSFSAETVRGLLHELHSEAMDAGTLQLLANGPALLASGPAAEVARIAERLRTGAALVARPLRIEVAEWDGADREAPAAVLGAVEFQRFTGNREPMWRSVATTRHGVAVALERMRWARYVRDIDVEVAQKQTMTHPVTDAFGEGGHALVRPFALVGADEFALHVQFAVSRRRGVVRTLPTGMVDAAELELPALESDWGCCSGRVPNGGALALTLKSQVACGGSRILTVRVVAPTPPANPIQGGLAILPCGALTSTGLARSLPAPDLRGNNVDEPESHPGCGHVPPEALLELMRQALGELAEATPVQCGAGYLLARGEPAALARCEAALRALQNRLVRTVTVAQTATLKPVESDAAAPPLHELVLPTLFGRQLLASHCFETNVVAEVNCAIAQEAGVLDPEVATLQSGAFLRARVAPADDGMHLQLVVDHRHALPPAARAVMPGGVLMATEVSLTVVNHHGLVGNGTATDHGDGPPVSVEGRGYRSVLATTVRW